MTNSSTKNKSLSNKSFYKTVFFTLLSIAFWCGVWWVCARAVNKELLLPSPHSVASRLLTLSGDATFWTTVFWSVARVTLGYLAGILTAVLLASATHFLKIVHALASPLITAVKAVPVASFIILALVWMEKGLIPTFISFLIVLPLVWQNLHEGFNSVDRNLIEMAQIYNVPVSRRITGIYIPSLSPYFTSALKTAVGLAWKSGVAAEVICRPDFAIGSRLYDAKNYLETTDVFAWTAVTVLLSVVIELIITSPWKKYK